MQQYIRIVMLGAYPGIVRILIILGNYITSMSFMHVVHASTLL